MSLMAATGLSLVSSITFTSSCPLAPPSLFAHRSTVDIACAYRVSVGDARAATTVLQWQQQ